MKDEQFVEEMLTYFTQAMRDDYEVEDSIIATIIKRSFAHRDEQWMEAMNETLEEHFPKLNQDDVSKPSSNGRGVAMMFMGLVTGRKALFTDKETKE